MITLLLESDLRHRTELADALMRQFVATVYTADSTTQAEDYGSALDRVDLLLAHVSPGQEETVLTLRSSLRSRHPGLAVAFLVRDEGEALRNQLEPEEEIFPLPSDPARLFEWLEGHFSQDRKSTSDESTAPLDPPEEPANPSNPEPALPSSPEPASSAASLPVPDAPVANPGSDQVPAPKPESVPPIPEPPPASSEPTETAIPPLPVGTELGDYELLEFVSRGGSSDRFVALQRSVDRKVRLRMLRPDYQDSTAAREQFREQAKAQASVRHPQIATVFEAHETESALFYTQEYIHEDSFETMTSNGVKLSEEELLLAIKSAAKAYRYLEEEECDTLPIWPEHLHLMPDGTVKIDNPVIICDPEDRVPKAEQLKNLAKCVHPLMDKEAVANETLPNLLYEMAGTVDENRGHPLETWSDLLQEIKYIETRWKEMSGGITARKAGIYLAIVLGSVAALVLLTVLSVKFYQMLTRSSIRVTDTLIRIPAGKFIYQDGQEAELEEYWISAYETTVAQYAEFLEYLETHPEEAERFDHPEQPDYKSSHRPVGWASYYRAARENRKWRFQDEERLYSVEVDLNCPIVMVDWWDAYAYARWKGRRLPTEMEWEKAARGRQGNLYPWGDELDVSKLNSGVDYVAPAAPDASTAGKPAEAADGRETEPPEGDGYRFWAPVDAIEGDTSHYLVVGMAGNVSEWTGDWVPHPNQAGKEVPVTRGASFMTREKSELTLTTRRISGDPSSRDLWLGFRTVSDLPPESEPPPGSLPPPSPGESDENPGPEAEPAPAVPAPGEDEASNPFADGPRETGN